MPVPIAGRMCAVNGSVRVELAHVGEDNSAGLRPPEDRLSVENLPTGAGYGNSIARLQVFHPLAACFQALDVLRHGHSLSHQLPPAPVAVFRAVEQAVCFPLQCGDFFQGVVDARVIAYRIFFERLEEIHLVVS